MPPSQMVMFVGLAEERDRVVLEMRENGIALGHILYEAPELESLIRIIANQRAGLLDPVSPELDPGSRLEVIPDPAWATRRPKDPGRERDVVLALRHPGLGWVSFLLPPHEAAALGQSLTALSQPPEGGSSETVPSASPNPSPT